MRDRSPANAAFSRQQPQALADGHAALHIIFRAFNLFRLHAYVDKFSNEAIVVRRTVRWVPAANKAYERFPAEVRREVEAAIEILEAGITPDRAKPLAGFGSNVYEIAIRFRTDAWRVVYALKIGGEIWMIHAFQKKSKSGIATPKAEIDTIRKRLKHLKMTMT